MRARRQSRSTAVIILLSALASGLPLPVTLSVVAGPPKTSPRGRHWTYDYYNRPTRFPVTQEDANRYARLDAPRRMTPAQIQRATGLLFWPRMLMQSEYDDLRDALDELFSERAKVNGAIGSKLYQSTRKRIRELRQQLKQTVTPEWDGYERKNYTDALSFLGSLARELENVDPPDPNDAK